VRLYKLVSKRQLLSMDPVTRGKGNRYVSLHDVYECEESICGEQAATQWQHMEEQFEAMGD
jgi:hypothetical protein